MATLEPREVSYNEPVSKTDLTVAAEKLRAWLDDLIRRRAFEEGSVRPGQVTEWKGLTEDFIKHADKMIWLFADHAGAPSDRFQTVVSDAAEDVLDAFDKRVEDLREDEYQSRRRRRTYGGW